MPKILVNDWLDKAVIALKDGGCDRVHVVTGAARPPLPFGVVENYCATWQRGMGASLLTGLTSIPANTSRVAIHLVDCPDIGPSVVQRLLGQETRRPIRATFQGQPGHPVILNRDHVTRVISRLPDETGAKVILKDMDILGIECSDLSSGKDIDYPEH